MGLNTGSRLAVFSIRKASRGGSIWVRAGTAFVNADNSVNVLLDVLPMDGRLHLREATAERREPSRVPDEVVATFDAVVAGGQA
jgi:hypothetical protein